jgi:hypothetical protein
MLDHSALGVQAAVGVNGRRHLDRGGILSNRLQRCRAVVYLQGRNPCASLELLDINIVTAGAVDTPKYSFALAQGCQMHP